MIAEAHEIVPCKDVKDVKDVLLVFNGDRHVVLTYNLSCERKLDCQSLFRRAVLGSKFASA